MPESRCAMTQAKACRWDFLPDDFDLAAALQRSRGLNPAIARVIANRGYAHDAGNFEGYLNPLLSSLHDPSLLRDMDAAVDRIMRAIRDREQITIYGDYDTDGATSTALLYKMFSFLSARANFYIPHRIEEGYGLNIGAVNALAASGTRLIVTVDNGITAAGPVAHAGSLGVDIIITDHHQPASGESLPAACAVVNPNRRDCPYPNKHLTGVGVAFKLCHAVLRAMRVPRSQATPFLRSLLDLVAIGTIADVAPLVGENRVLVKHGLEVLMNTRNPGLIGIKRALELEGARMTAQRIGFQIAPRLNAAGRTDHAAISVQLLTATDPNAAFEMASLLDRLNRDRRTMEGAILKACQQQIREELDLDENLVIVVSGRDWHLGVIGIVASKIVEMHHRPVIVISENGEIGKGSARSIKGFNIHDALEACREHLIAFGGHPFAAGLQVKPARIPALRQAVNDYARSIMHEENLVPSLVIDTVVEPRETGETLLRDLRVLEPHGPANPLPVMAMASLRLAEKPRIVGANHLKFCLRSDNTFFDAIGFGLGHFLPVLDANLQEPVEVAFVPTVNDYYCEERLQLDVKDIRVTARV
jgi:single-stranded-DNA-specific exonuclease